MQSIYPFGFFKAAMMAVRSRHQRAFIPALALSLVIAAPAAFGKTVRNPAIKAEFIAANPCPSGAGLSARCDGWQVDHIEPLCAGGVDAAHNMQWLTVQEHKWKTRTDVRVCRALRVGG